MDNPDDRLREWRKLLKVLGAPNVDAPAPAALEKVRDDPSIYEPIAIEPQVTIARASVLSPRTGDGVGYEVLLKNDAYEDAFAGSADISGIVQVGFYGHAPAISRIEYEVELDSAVAESEGDDSTTELRGHVFEPAGESWGTQAHGTFKYEMNTASGIGKVWEYAFSTPIMVRLPARDRVFLRLLYRERARRVLKQEEQGDLQAAYQSGVIREEHHLAIKLESGEVLKVEIGDEFLAFIAR